jgi:hypothetical protein
VTLWKVRKFKEAKGYIENSAKIINEIIFNQQVSRIGKLAKLNLYGLIGMSLAASTAYITGNIKEAVDICDDIISQLKGYDLAVKPLLVAYKNELFGFSGKLVRNIQTVIEALQKNSSSASSITSPDYLITKEYESILYVSIFVPFISPKTPIIRRSELEKAQENSAAPLSKTDLAFILNNPTFTPMPSNSKSVSHATSRRSLPAIQRDNYSKLMRSVVEKEYPKTIPEIIRKKKKVRKRRMNYSLAIDMPHKMPPITNFKRPFDSVPRSSKREIFVKRDSVSLSVSPRVRSNSVRQSLNRSRLDPTPSRLNPRLSGHAKMLYLSPSFQTKQLSGTVVIKPNYFNPAKKEKHIMVELSRKRPSRAYSPLSMQPSVHDDSDSGHVSTFTDYL